MKFSSKTILMTLSVIGGLIAIAQSTAADKRQLEIIEEKIDEKMKDLEKRVANLTEDN